MRAAAIAIVLSCSATAVAQPSEAERLYNDGQRAYDAGRYDDAVAAWDRSYALSKLPALLFNIGQAYRLRAWTGDCSRAADAYKKFIAVQPTSPQRGQVEGFLAELGPCVDRERAAQPAAPVAPAPIPPPITHVDDPGRGKRLLAYGSGATGALLVGVAVYYGHRAATLSDEVTSACRAGCTFAEVAAKDAEGRSADRKQYVFYGLGAAALVTGGVLYWMAGREHPSTVVSVDSHGSAVARSIAEWRCGVEIDAHGGYIGVAGSF